MRPPLDELRNLLKAVLPEYRRVSEAPSINFIRDEEDKKGVTPGTFQMAEAKKLYKSIDADGSVFLVQNPAVWKCINEGNGNFTFTRPEPKKVFTYEQARSESGMTQIRSSRSLNFMRENF